MLHIIPKYEHIVSRGNDINGFRICSGFFLIMRDSNSSMEVGSGRRGASVSTRCSELTLVCLSNSWQTRCQQPNTEAYIGRRMQFMFALLERAVEGRAVVFEEEIWTSYVLASKCRTCHRQLKRLPRYYDEVLATKIAADFLQQFWYLYSKSDRINFASSKLKKKFNGHFQKHLQK